MKYSAFMSWRYGGGRFSLRNDLLHRHLAIDMEQEKWGLDIVLDRLVDSHMEYPKVPRPLVEDNVFRVLAEALKGTCFQSNFSENIWTTK